MLGFGNIHSPLTLKIHLLMMVKNHSMRPNYFVANNSNNHQLVNHNVISCSNKVLNKNKTKKKTTKRGIEWKSAKKTETIDSNAKEKQIVFLYKIRMNNKSRKHTNYTHIQRSVQ